MTSTSRVGEDIQAMRERDPSARSALEVFLTSPGVCALAWHRVAHWLWRWEWFLAAGIVSNVARWLTGIEIHPGATVGRRLVIDHGMGAVIGETAIIGDDCLIYHGVTLGGKTQTSRAQVTGQRHPTLGNRVLVGAGAAILGPVTIGDGATVGALAVVIEDVPQGALVVGIPAKVKKRTKRK